MDVIGEPGTKALCHGDKCIQLSDEQLEHLKILNVAQARGYLIRQVRPDLSENERKILDKWIEDEVDISPVCVPNTTSSHKFKRKDA